MRKWESFSLSSLTHEVQIALSSECMSNETNHFMKLYAAVDDGRQRHQHAHVCVHLCIHQAEGQGLVTNQGLQQFTKTLKKQPLGGTEVFLGFVFFLKIGGRIIGGGLARSLIQSLFLKETSCRCLWSSGHGDPTFWSLHLCIVLMYNTDLVCCQKLRQGCPRAEPGLDVSPSCLLCPCNSPHCYWTMGLSVFSNRLAAI